MADGLYQKIIGEMKKTDFSGNILEILKGQSMEGIYGMLDGLSVDELDELLMPFHRNKADEVTQADDKSWSTFEAALVHKLVIDGAQPEAFAELHSKMNEAYEKSRNYQGPKQEGRAEHIGRGFNAGWMTYEALLIAKDAAQIATATEGMLAVYGGNTEAFANGLHEYGFVILPELFHEGRERSELVRPILNAAGITTDEQVTQVIASIQSYGNDKVGSGEYLRKEAAIQHLLDKYPDATRESTPALATVFTAEAAPTWESNFKMSRPKDIRKLQTLLRANGYRGRDGEELALDGDFGPNTEYATQEYAQDNGIDLGRVTGAARLVEMIQNSQESEVAAEQVAAEPVQASEKSIPIPRPRPDQTASTSAPEETAATFGTNNGRTVTVKDGASLSIIATEWNKAHDGINVTWQEIAKENGIAINDSGTDIANHADVQKGMTLVIPTPA